MRSSVRSKRRTKIHPFATIVVATMVATSTTVMRGVHAQSCNAVPPERRATELDTKDDVDDGSGGGRRGNGRQQQQQQQQRPDVPRVDPDVRCGLYMAPTTLSRPLLAGDATGAADTLGDDVPLYGVFAGRDYDRDERINPLDVAVQVVDPRPAPADLPPWWIPSYLWPSSTTLATFDAANVGTLLPGLGMLPRGVYPLQDRRRRYRGRNGRGRGLPNLDFEGSRDRAPESPRSDPRAGASTHYRNTTFSTDRNVRNGRELFNKYPPEWFDRQKSLWGKDAVVVVPGDLEYVEHALQTWEFRVSGDLDSVGAQTAWREYVVGHETSWNPAVEAIMPRSPERAATMLYDGVAETLVNEMDGNDDDHDETESDDATTRSIDWLEEHGMCLDNIQVRSRLLTDDDHYPQRAVHATRGLLQDDVVITSPVVHMHREHLRVKRSKKMQLLLNYCYGHDSSSLLFFPYAPGVQSIRDYRGGAAGADGRRIVEPNVAWRWFTTRPSHDALEKARSASVDELLRAPPQDLGLLMELVALRDIAADEELVLDYGDGWRGAWEEHARTWVAPDDAGDAHAHNNSAWHYTQMDRIYLEDDPRYPPPNVQVRVWVDRSTLDDVDEVGWYGWNPSKKKEHRYSLENTELCRVVHTSDSEGNGRMAFYHIMLSKDHKPVKNVPWQYITFVDAPYTSNQFLAQAFRREIQLPDAMMFDAWRDLEKKTSTATATKSDSVSPKTTSSSASATNRALESANCDLWMAESTIPNTGYGLFTGKNLDRDQVISPLDVAIQVADANANMRKQNDLRNQDGHPPLETWLLSGHYWEASVTEAVFDSYNTWSILPGLGMLTQSHPALANLDAEGCGSREPSSRSEPHAGASSHYQEVTFSTDRPLPAGHELFAKHDFTWYQARQSIFGKEFAMGEDYDAADRILEGWRMAMSGNIDSQSAQSVWHFLVNTVGPHMKPGVQRAIPKTAPEAAATLNGGKGTAHSAAPDAVRSIEWLEQNGMCVDNIVVNKEADEVLGRGAFAKRLIKEGNVVAPSPVIHMRREHLETIMLDENNQAGFRGFQLLLNYCFGNPSSSVLLFPTSPGVNLINHPREGQTANVGLRWSDRMTKTEMLKMTVEELMSSEPGLMMEFYALTDIQPGDPILLDYGKSWTDAWSEHLETWFEPVNAANYVSAWDFEKADQIYVETEHEYPSWIQVRVWIDRNALGMPDAKGWRKWTMSDKISGSLDETELCRVVSKSPSSDPSETLYNVILIHDNVFVKNVPWKFITFAEAPYTGNQFLRQAFRHEIGLPDEMVPDEWKDLEPDPTEQATCGLYMAVSSIPNAGFGMFSARNISTNDRIFSGEVVVQVEDMDLNTKLRHWSQKEFEFEEPDWLLENYYWNSEVGLGYYEAPHIESIIPGLGMLANSHMGLVNADTMFPTRIVTLHRGRDPGAGASTNYHDFHYIARKDIQVGEELYVSYGDKWFKNRKDLGMIPISKSFREADKALKELYEHLDRDISTPEAKEAWESMMKAMEEEEDKRLVNAFPRKLEELPKAVQEGTAALSVPNRIRSVEWLDANGLCLDNIKPSRSTIRQAGQGAFATRSLEKGEIIAPLPMVHIRRRHMEVYDGDDYDNQDAAVWKDGTQQILNYCYGHPESSLLLFPYAPVVNYVNHNFTDFNAEIRWSTLGKDNAEWMQRSPDDLDSEDHSGLVMEMVATRKIEAGEEILLNYGSNWESAWNKHVEEFSPTTKDKEYMSATEMNRRMMWLKTVDELKVDPYPGKKIMTICFAGELPKASEDETKPTIQWTFSSDIYEDFDSAEICEVIRREEKISTEKAYARSDSVDPLGLHYTVRMIGSSRTRGIVVRGVPRLAIQFYDKQYSSDMFWRRAFRHEIGIPDEIFPQAWRDLL